MKKNLLLVTVFLVIALFSIHAYAEENKLYFTLPWLDIFMHLFGGFVIAIGCVAVYRLYPRTVDTLSFCIGTLLTVLAIGALWELYEITLDHMARVDRFNLIDMLSDLMNDLIGASVALFMVVQKKYHEK